MKIDFIPDINRGHEAAMGYGATDRFIVKVLWWHLGTFTLLVFLNAVVKLGALYPSPLAWRVIGIPEAIVAFGIAALAALVPIFLAGKIHNHYVWRVVVTTALTVYSYLLVFVSGGSIEMHFHFFIIAALLVVYADWRLGWILFVLTGLHHGILNYVEPGWLYFYGRNDFSVIAHAVPVLVMVIFTTYLCNAFRNSVLGLKEAQKDIAARNAELEKLKQGLEVKVKERTTDLSDKLFALEKINLLMADSELKVEGLKKEISMLKGDMGSAEGANKDIHDMEK